MVILDIDGALAVPVEGDPVLAAGVHSEGAAALAFEFAKPVAGQMAT